MMALMVASAAVTAASAVMAGNQRAGQYDAQRQAEEFNAAQFANEAVAARREGVAAEVLQRRRADQVMGAQQGAVTQMGLDASRGSAAVTFRQALEDAEVDALNIRYGAEQRARGFGAQAEQSRFGARVASMNSRQAQQSGYLSAAGSVLSSIGGYYRSRAAERAAGGSGG